MDKQQGFSSHYLAKRTAILLVVALWATACIQTPAPRPAATEPQASLQVQAIEPLAAAQAQSPVQLAVPALGLEAPVVPMGWTVTEVNGERTTKWALPADALGWHVNSVGAGAGGRVIVSGQQAVGDALLAPLARGEMSSGQEILLTDSTGRTFVYRITAVSEPIVLANPSAEEEAQAAAYVAPSDQALLTLITGWPDFTTTHRIFAEAELVGQRP